MKRYSTISCLAIFCQLFLGFHGFCQSNAPGIHIIQQPDFAPVCEGEGASLKVQASGSGLSYQWQVFKRFGNFEDLQDGNGYSGSHSSKLNIASFTKSMSQYSYRCKISNGASEIYSEPVITELKNAVIIWQPANGTGFVGDYHSMEIYAAGAGLKYQWQKNTGSGFINMVDDSIYTGCNASILSIANLAKKMDGYQFRCLVSGKSCEVVTLVSDPATLTVSTDVNPMKSMMGGDPSNVIWYIGGGTEVTPTFMGNPMVYVDGAIKLVNDGQIRSRNGFGPSADIYLSGHLYNENPSVNLFPNNDISQLIFVGADDQKIEGGNATKNNFYKLRIDKTSSTGKLTLINDISIRRYIELSKGDLNLQASKAYLTLVNSSNAPIALALSNLDSFPKILNETENNRIYGNTNTAAVVVANQLVVSNPNNPFNAGPLNLGNMGAEIFDPADYIGGEAVTIERSHFQFVNGPETSIGRTYKITSPVTPIPSEMDFTFHYLDADLNGASENNLTIFKSDNSGGTWTARAATLNTTANTIVQTDVADITTWWTAFPCTNAPNVFFYQSPEMHLCDGVAYTITPANTGGPATTYEWILAGDTLGLNQDHYNVTGVENTPNQTLEFIAYNSSGCFDRAFTTLVHEDTLTADLGPDIGLCQGLSDTIFCLTNNGTFFLWLVDGVVVNGNGSPDPFYVFHANVHGLGPHTVEVQTDNGYCFAEDEMIVTVHPEVFANVGPDLTRCVQGTTLLDANPSGGTTPYDFNWSYGGASTQTINAPNANTSYSVTVTDANGCTRADQMYMCFSNLQLTQTHTNLNCFGDSNGTIDLTVNGVYNIPLNFLWSNGATTEDLTGLSAGTYTVTVTDFNGCSGSCTKTLNVTLTQPPALALSNVVTHVTCNGANNGAINLSVTGGTPGYTYLWSNGITTQDLTGLSGGTYVVTVTDNNSCTATSSIVVNEPAVLGEPPFTSPDITNVTCHGFSNGAISWTIQGGTAPYAFSWTGPNGFTSTVEDPTNLAGGTYNVTVTDANSCTYSRSMNVFEPTQLATVITPENISCFGGSDGSIVQNPSGGTQFGSSPYYLFNWTGPNGFTSTSKNIYPLAAGDYNLTITDLNGCTLTPPTTTISGPATELVVTGTVTNSTCFGANNGSITTTVTGGWGGYTYSWLDPEDNDMPPTPNQSNLGPGVYSLYVSDANGCVVSEYFTVEEPDEIFLNETITHISCNGESDGSIFLNVTGGGGGFTYEWQWAGGSSTASFIDNLSGPTQDYSVTVTDASNCTKTAVFEVVEPDMITATSVVTNITCHGYGDGSIDLTVSGGNPGYTFSWTGPNGYTASSEDIFDLVPGAYAVTISDMNACTGPVLNFNITQPTQLAASPVITMPLECFGDTDGQMNANPSGGTPPYTYLWTFPNSNTATTQYISNLSLTGTYSVEVHDSKGCSTSPATATIDLTSPTEIMTSGIITDVTINGYSNGAIDLSVTGGTGAYTYLWSNSETTEDITGIPAGAYTVTVTDANNCTKTSTFTVNEPTVLEIVLEDLTNISCHGETDGSIYAYGEGGVSPYTYLWSTGSTDPEIYSLAVGDYTLTVTDANGAIAIATYSITEPDPLADNAVVVNVSCFMSSDGSISLFPTGGTAPYNYIWSNQETTSAITDLYAGSYSVTIFDDHGCQFFETYTITEPDILEVTSTSTPASCFGANDGSITMTVTGGTSPYSYNWNNNNGSGSGAGTTIPNLTSDFYNITLTDNNGCTAVTSAFVGEPQEITVFITGNEEICAGESSVLEATTGYASYLWNTSETTESITATTNGTYSVTVTDATGCTATNEFLLTVHPLPVILTSTNQSICVGTPIPALTVTVGTNVTADWYDAATGGNLLLANNTSYTPPGAGTYYAEARHTVNGCISAARTAVTLTIYDLPVAVASDDVTICQGNSTVINANGSSGSAPLGYAWTPTTGLNNPNIVNPTASPNTTTTYTVQVTDSHGCTATDMVTVNVNPKPIADAGADATICAGSTTQLNATVNSNNGPFTYQWTPTSGLSDPNIHNPLANPLSTTTYTVQVTDVNGCTGTDAVFVNVNPRPTLTLDSTVCAPNLLSYSAYVHSNANQLTADYGTVTNNGNGTFTISGIPPGQDVTLTATLTATGCQRILVVTGINCPCPTINAPASNGDEAICDGFPIPALSVTVGPNETADWYDAPTGGNLLLAGSTSYTPIAAGTYYAEAHNTVNDCVSDDRTAVTLTINPLPTAVAGPDVAICLNASAQLDASGSSGSGTLDYLWSPSTGLNNPNIANPIASPTTTTTYTVEVTDGNGCVDADELTVTVNPLPTLTVNDTICAPNLLTYSVLVTTNGNSVTATLGTVTNNGGGNFTVSSVPTGQNVTITATIAATGCQFSQLVNSPICPCPFVGVPVSNGNQTICSNSPIPALTVTVGNNETADWYSAPTGGTLLLSGNTSYTPTAGGTYYAQGRNTINQCTSAVRTAVTLTVNPVPVANAGPDVAICSTFSAQLNAGSSTGNAPLSYSWSPTGSLNNPNIVNPIATPATTTTYTVTVTDGNGCTGTDQVKVTVNPLPILTVNDTICAPNLLSYSVLLFTNGNAVTATLGTVTNNGGGNYTVSGVPTGNNVDITATLTATGCQKTQTVISPSCPCPPVSIPVSGGNQTICASSPIPALTVTVGTDETADWYDAPSGGNLLLAGNTSYTPIAAGTYYAEAHNVINNCLSLTRTAMMLVINPLPVADAGADATICNGSSTQLNAGGSSGNNPLTYLWSPATALSNPNIVNPVASPQITRTYTVQVTDVNGCTATDQVTVNVNPRPTLTVTSVVCALDLQTYRVNLETNADNVTANFGNVIDYGGGSWAVINIPDGQNVNVTAIFTATGCQRSQSVNAPDCSCPAVNPPVSHGDEDICIGAPIPSLGVSVGLNETADWYDAPTGGTLLLMGDTTYLPTAAGTFYAQTRVTFSGCVSSIRTAVTLSIHPLPVADAGPDATICAGSSTMLNAGGSSGSGVLTYSWTPIIGLSNPNIVNPMASPTTTRTYTVLVTDENGCTASDAVTVNVNVLPTANAGPDVAICIGTSTQLNASSNGPATYAWSPATGLSATNIPNPVANPTVTTTYTVTVTNSNGCTATDQVKVTVNTLPIAVAGPFAELCIGGSTQLNAGGSSGTAPLSFSWSPTATLNNPLIVNPIATPTSTTTYTVTVTNGNGCTATSQVSVLVNPLPVANAGADAAICLGGNTQLNASGSSGSGTLSYAWSPGTGLSATNIPNPIANPTSTTTYTVTVTDGNGCTQTDAVTVTVNPLPAMAIDSATCSPDFNTYSVYLTTNAITVVASAGNVNNYGSGHFTVTDIPNGPSVIITAIHPATGCQTTQEVFPPLCDCSAMQPPVSNGNQSTCTGSPLPALSVTVGNNEIAYWYSAPVGGVLLLANSNSYVPTGAGTFYAETHSTVNNCTSATRTAVSLAIHPALLANAGTNSAICIGGTKQLAASSSNGTAPFTYAWSPAGSLNNPAIANPVASPTGTTNYTVTITDSHGCTGTSQVLVTVNPLPTLTVNNVTCDPGLSTYRVLITTNANTVTATLGTVTSAGGGMYNINGIPTGQNVTVTVTLTATGCSKTQVINSPNCNCPVVNPPVSGGNQSVCAGSPFPTLTVTVPAGQSANWYDAPTGGNVLAANTTSYTPTAPGNFYVEAVIVNNNCTSATRTLITLSILASPTANAGADDTTCGGVGVQLDASGSSGTGGLAFAWGPATGLNNPDIVNPIASPLATTNYVVTVTNGAGCTATDAVMVTVAPTPAITIDMTACAMDLMTYDVELTSDADLLTASVGILTDNGNGTFSVTGIPAGQNVVLTATNTTTNCVWTQTVTAPNCNCPVVSAPFSNGDQEICEGEPFHVISVLVGPGETADWYDAPTGGNLILAGNTEYLPTGPGVFYVEARVVANSCISSSRTQMVVVVFPLPTVVFDDPSDVCAGTSPITLTATPTGGMFEGTGVVGDQFDPVAAGAGVHVLTYSFTDGNGCEAIDSQTIEVVGPTVTLGSNSPVCDGGDLELTESGGHGTSWSWTGPNGFASSEQNPVVPLLTAAGEGVYEVTVTSALGCVKTDSITVVLNPPLDLALSPASPEFCPGGSVQLVATASGGSGVFDYNWQTPSLGTAGTQDIFADEAGTYSVTATDGSGCTITGSVDVTALPAMAVVFASTNASCNSSDGSLTATVSGGTTPYAYLWDGLTETTNMLTNVPAGGYQLIVTDGAGCTLSAIGNVGNSGAPAISLVGQVNVACAGAATGSIDVSVSGGVPPYSYSWSNGETTQDIGGLMAGQYALEVTDVLGCIVSNTYSITQPPAITGTLAVTETTTPTSSNGAIDLTPMGGVPPYTYAWSNGLNSQDISNLFIGPYSVTITDANGCTVVESTTVTAVGALSTNLVVQPISCFGAGNGSLQVVITGGAMPYSILWSNGSTQATISNLLPGIYQVTVTDLDGSTSTKSATLVQPPLLQSFTQKTDNICQGASAGTGKIFPSGGTMPYSYLWSDGQTTQTATGLMAGVYTVTVTDSRGCTNVKSVTVGEPTAIQIAVNAVTDNDCYGQSMGAIDIGVTGGAFPYSAIWSQGSSTQDISGLAAGTYTVTITDFAACTTTASVIVGQSPQITISFDQTSVTCHGGADGSLTATVTGGVPGYQYLWETGDTTAAIGNLASGNYFVTVTDALGCTRADVKFVSQPDELLGHPVATNVSCYGLANGIASVQPTGGTAPYSYLWATGSMDSTLQDLVPGTYGITITDAAGCTKAETVQVTQPNLLTATSVVTDLNCYGDFTGAIDLTITGGVPLPVGGYNVSWQIGQFTEDIDQLSAGEYAVEILDANGCIFEDTIAVAQPDELVAAATVDSISCYGANDGTIGLTISGGIVPYTYAWDNGGTVAQLTGLSEGDYTSTVTDGHGCTLTSEYTITQPDFLSIAYQIQRAGCKANNDGRINITMEGGVPAYTFNWSTGATTEDISQLTIGTYHVTATDHNGCTAVESLNVASSGGTFHAHFLAASGLFDVDSVEVNSDDIIQFVDVSLPAPLAWEWHFGDPDSSTSSLPNPTFSYPNDDMVAQSSYMATLIASNLHCRDTMTKQIWITNNLRLNAPKEDSLTYLQFTEVMAYPNPTSGMVNLKVSLSREEKVRLYVLDVLGQVLQQDELEGDDHYETKLDLGNYLPGIYFINLKSQNQVHTLKVVVSEQ